MASGADLKVKLLQFVTEQQATLAQMDASYQAERARVVTQITRVQAVLSKWDTNVETLVDTLALAGIQVRT